MAQEKLHPVCAQRVEGSSQPTCLYLAEVCRENKECRYTYTILNKYLIGPGENNVCFIVVVYIVCFFYDCAEGNIKKNKILGVN